ncbi:FAD-dependent oxidoreductase [Sphingomonas bacterium]|uniref:FAD-dependent oxidoreductase n=1 Tax=Sphingomonas bacterium TaxID=1895847 RepID=UPI001575CB94|nr:FAD-dependent oxidoreductase [Sphingomonas bacterium]
MNVGDERTQSVWMNHGGPANRPPLKAEVETDIVIVGAGIVGLSIAYELAQAGRRVVVLDRGRPGLGQSARTTGHLAWQLDDYYHVLRRERGDADAQAYHQRVAAAIDRIEEIARTENIDCDFARVDGYLFAASENGPAELVEEERACRELGIAGVRFVDRAPVPGRDTGRALLWPGQARFHVLKYLDGLAQAIERLGGRIYGDTAVCGPSEDENGATIKLENGITLRASQTVMAANAALGDLPIQTKMEPYRAYAIAGPVPKGSVEDALVWDTLDNYHYVRIQPEADHDVLIVGGEDHRLGEEDDGEARLEALERWTREHYPMFKRRSHGWSGMVLEPVDLLPFSGLAHGKKRIYLHTGDSGEGLTNGVLGALLIRDLIVYGGTPDQAMFAPTRVTLQAAGDLAANLGHAVANFAEYLTPGGKSGVDELRPGEAALVRHGLKKVAAFRDGDGRLHLRSATCTHLGCIVHWNGLERAWDCPCHGSQFAPDGTVLSGPATAPLPEVEA